MRKTTKIMNIATALGALVAPAAAPALAQASTTDQAHIGRASDAKAEVKIPHGADLLSFTVHDKADGMVVAQHASHSSHASHASHASSAY